MIITRPPLSGIIGPFGVPAPQVEFDARNLTDGNGNPITTWPDSSGNGHNGTGFGGAGLIEVTGVLNGNPVARWSGGAANRVEFSGDPTATAFTIISVLKCTDSGTRSVFAGTVAGNQPVLWVDANTVQLVEADTAVLASASTSLGTSTFYTIGLTYDGSTGAYAFYNNGSADGSGTATAVSFVAFSRVGCRNGNQNSFKGDVAYVAQWNTILTSGQLTAQFNALRTIWANY